MRQATSLFLLWSALLPAASEAAIYRCTATDGHTTFSDSPCEASQHEQAMQVPDINLIRPPERRERIRSSDGSGGQVIVTGQRTDGCGDLLSPRERRQLVIRQQVRQGMTQADIESAFGEPERISSSNGRTTWYYKDEDSGRTRRISFDEAGCVSGRKKR